MAFIIVYGNPDAAVLAQELSKEFEARVHHVQPGRVFEVVVVMLERGAGVVRRIDVDALHFAGVERQQRLQRLQVVAVDEDTLGRDALPRVRRIRDNGRDALPRVRPASVAQERDPPVVYPLLSQ